MRLTLALTIAAFALVVPSQSDDLVGLWGAETAFGPHVTGEITLERTADACVVRVAGFEARGVCTGNRIEAALPAREGRLRARFEDNAALVRGFWIQPPTSRPAYASPVVMRRVGQRVWRGTVAPLEDDEDAVGFVPRSPGALPYTYRPPVQEDDGWVTGRAGAAGLSEERLQALVQRVATAAPGAANSPRIHSILVARHGLLVLDEYFFGFASDRLHDLRSASKTFTSIMVGIAMDHGARFTMNTTITSVFPGEAPGDDPRRARITLAQLLTHTSGLACDDNDDRSPGNEDAMQAPENHDWYRFILGLPVAHTPGSTYAYCSGGINLAAGVVARATGTWLPEFFDRYLARSLQIDRYAMNLMPDGQAYGGGGVYMRPRDLLKFGQVFLDKGLWKGRRVVSAKWVADSTARHADTPDGSSDGYGWHRHVLHVGERAFDEYEANGNGGQFLIVVPALDLAIVITAGNYGQYPIWKKFRDELVPQFILSAADIPPSGPAR